MKKNMKKPKIFIGLLIVFIIVGFVIIDQLEIITNEDDMEEIAFQTIYEFGIMASDSYKTVQEIVSKYNGKLRVHAKDLKKYQGRYFVLFDDANKNQYISIRGTSNSGNAFEDSKYVKIKDKKTGLYMHKGFWESSTETYNSAIEHLNKEYNTYITGHSLGGAEAAILHLFLHEDGFNVVRTITFGQPKFTNAEGMEKYEDINLLRVVDGMDLVPLVPPTTVVSAVHGRYRHFGPEIVLLDDIYYSFLDKHAGENPAVTSLWKKLIAGETSVKEHFMINYLKRIELKLNKNVMIPYEEHKNYLKKI